ncbi:MAG: hypothetical protein RL591_1374 [Planctomycetota bacterium]
MTVLHAPSRRIRFSTQNERGFVLVAVLVVLAAAILIATGSIFSARSGTAASRASIAEERLRNAALDGVALAADALARDRVRILAGGTPELEANLLERVDGDERIDVQLVAMPLGGFVEPEGAKFPLARMDPAISKVFSEILGASSGADELREAVLDALASRRDATSVESILVQLPESERVRAMKVLLGSLRSTNVSDDTAERDRSSDSEEVPMISLVSAHAREPLVDQSGVSRLDLVAAAGNEDTRPSDQLNSVSNDRRSDAALEAFDEAELKAIDEVVRKVGAEPDDSALAEACLARGVALARREEILATATLHQGALAPARLDLLRAPRPVLEAFAQLENLPDGFAERVESVRDALDAAERTNTAWLVERRVLSAEEHARIAGRVTSRSTAWRFRVVAQLGTAATDAGAAERLTTFDERTASSSSRGGALAAFDAIVEVGGPSPRLVYLREVSMLDTARALGLASLERDAQDSNREGDARDGTSGDVNPSASVNEPERTDVEETSRDVFPSPSEPAKLTEPAAPPSRPQRGTSDPFGRDVGSARRSR